MILQMILSICLIHTREVIALCVQKRVNYEHHCSSFNLVLFVSFRYFQTSISLLFWNNFFSLTQHFGVFNIHCCCQIFEIFWYVWLFFFQSLGMFVLWAKCSLIRNNCIRRFRIECDWIHLQFKCLQKMVLSWFWTVCVFIKVTFWANDIEKTEFFDQKGHQSSARPAVQLNSATFNYYSFYIENEVKKCPNTREARAANRA